MAFRDEVIRNPRFLHHRGSGVPDPGAALESCDRLAGLLGDTGHDRLLLDDRAVELASAPMFDYAQANYAARLLAHRCRRIAWPGNPDDIDCDRFFATVCANHGLKLGYFLAGDAAIEWLLAAPDNPKPAACE